MAQNKLSKGSTQRLKIIKDHITAITLAVTSLPESEIEDLVRRAAIPTARDGYPANSMPESTSGGGTSDPTGTTATSRINSKEVSDYLGKSLKSLERSLTHAVKDLLDAQGILDNIDRAIEKKKERPTSVPCSICLELPAEISGWCRPDYNDWHKHGSPDRVIWEMYKRRDIDKDTDQLRVPECPPPGGDRPAVRGPWRITGTE